MDIPSGMVNSNSLVIAISHRAHRYALCRCRPRQIAQQQEPRETSDLVSPRGGCPLYIPPHDTPRHLYGL